MARQIKGALLGCRLPKPPLLLSSCSYSWSDLVTAKSSSSSDFSLSFVEPQDNVLRLPDEEIFYGTKVQDLALVSKRPFYEVIAATIKRTWSLKGSLNSFLLMRDFFF